MVNAIYNVQLEYERKIKKGAKYSFPAGKYEKLFYNSSAFRLFQVEANRTQLLLKGWEIYLNSVFCYMPHGDSPTRRAFYDAWLFGCIPVIRQAEVS
jgi:hypothetical protein